jgi:hypothetical protein
MNKNTDQDRFIVSKDWITGFNSKVKEKELNSIYEPSIRLGTVKLDELYIDRQSAKNPKGYQRPADEDRAMEIAERFSPLARTIPLVSKRKGTNKYYIINGQHTLRS